MPLLSDQLPAVSGRYNVGLVDIEVPVAPRQNLSDAVLKETGEPAFQLQTVLFSLYYPAAHGSIAPTPKRYRRWVDKPLSSTAEGYARFAKCNNVITRPVFRFALWMLAGSTKIPALLDAPLNDTIKMYRDYDSVHPPDSDGGIPQFPVIVFSHGVASSRNSYSQYCSEMASRGYIIAAIEHRDGSGPATNIINEKSQRQRFHFNEQGLEPKPDTHAFKKAQLAMRQAELEETVRILRDINEGKGRMVYERNVRGEGKDLAAWRGRMMWNRLVLGGHSFGATLALQALKGAPSETLPFVGAIMFDPGKNSGPLQDDIDVPIVIVHSQSWSAKYSIFQGRPHFEVVKDLVQKVIDTKYKHAWFVTSKGTSHASVTDAPLVEPFLLSMSTGSTISAKQGVLRYVMISQQFMNYLHNGDRQSILREERTHNSYDDPNARAVSNDIGQHWQIHISPSAACPATGYCGLDSEDGESEKTTTND